MELSTLTTLVQMTGMLLVAALLHELTRILPGRFLSYWRWAWVGLVVSLFALLISMQLEDLLGVRNPSSIAFLIIFCLTEYAFGFFLWAGCRNFTTNQEIDAGDLPIVAVPACAGFLLPILFRDIHSLVPIHAALMAFYFGASYYICRRETGTRGVPLGLRLIRLALIGLTLLFVHYFILLGICRFTASDYGMSYLNFSSLFDASLEIGMAFGMVLLATERVRVELEERNHRLAAISSELEDAARTDPLTGLLNRRAFDESTRNPTIGSGSVAILDLNDLKPLNDEYGHNAGDVALRLVARAMRIHFRVTDPLYRMGGDEFAVVMPGCAADELAFRMGKIDDALAGQRFPGIDKPIDLTVAWGVASYSSSADLASAAAIADERMFAQKKKRKGGSRASLSSVSV
jgi:diguanylate cyclase (GGDEF)-like protein